VQSLLRAIQQRKLDRVAAAYAVAAWILVQAASIALPTFGAPVWVLKVLIAAAVTGFPLALWIAWHAAAPAQDLGQGIEALRRTDVALLVILSLVLVFVGVQFAFQFGLIGKKSAPAAAREHHYYFRNVPSPPPASVAVLPFLNLSGDPAKEYFSDGIADELLNHLASARTLRVAARTSSFSFKGKNKDIREIARALNVSAVVEGSVREDGHHLRIAAQLIKASDGYQLWSSVYDRDLSNVLQLQDEIANSIAAALTHTLSGGQLPVATQGERTPIDPAAYRDYLKAKALAALKTDEGDAKSVEIFKRVAAREPRFAPAFAALGRTYLHMAQFHNDQPKLLLSAETALQHALKSDPRNLEALATHLHLATLKWDWRAAAKDAKSLQTINAHNVYTLRGLFSFYDALGFPEQEAAVLREATRLDPLSFVDLNNLASVYNDRGQYVEAASAAEDALSLKPNRPLALYSLCLAYAGMKRLDRARAVVRQLATLQKDASAACALKIASLSGDRQHAHRLARTLAGDFPSFIFDEGDIGYFYALANEFDAALPWFERGYDKRNAHIFSVPLTAGTPADLVQSAGWKALLARPGARAWQEAHERLAEQLARN